MARENYHLGSSPHLSFHACAGDLRIQSWDLEEVQLLSRQEEEAIHVEEAAGALTISGMMPEMVNVPPGATLSLQRCAGDVHAANVASLRVEQHQGALSLQQVSQVELITVNGDVRVRQARSLQVTTLHGDLFIGTVEENVTLAVIHGDIVLEGAKGQSALADITGDVVIRNPAGHLEVRQVTGDVALSGNLQTGDYQLAVLGDVHLYLEPTSDVELELEARLGRIDCDLALLEGVESAHGLSGKMGQGAAQLHVVTNTGDVRLRPLGADQVRREMEKERIRAEAHARREAERARRLSEKAQRASERLAEKAEKGAAKMRRWQFNWGAPQSTYAARPQQEKMSRESLEDERVAILKMLAEGKISAEQAESLLDALEG